MKRVFSRYGGRLALSISVILVSLYFSSCDLTWHSGGGGSSGSGSVSFRITWLDGGARTDGENLFLPLALDCAGSGVSTVSAFVYDSSGRLVASGGPWNCDAHSGVIEGVPAGDGYSLVVLGSDSSGGAKYRGEASGLSVRKGKTTDAGEVVAVVCVPSPSGPQDEAVFASSSVDIDWADVSGASKYRLQVSSDSQFGSVVLDVEIQGSFYQVSGLPAGRYFWRVKSIDGFGNESAWSDVWHVRLQSALGKIVFGSDASGNNDIWVMNEDGTGRVQLTSDSVHEAAPKWSPDGTKIAYKKVSGNGVNEIWIMDADGSNQYQLTHAYDNGAQYGVSTYAWYPDGTKIAYVAGYDFVEDKIFTINLDGTGNAILIDHPNAKDIEVDVCPADPNKIVYMYDIYNWSCYREIHLWDGVNDTLLVPNDGYGDRYPRFSPDCSKIIWGMATGTGCSTGSIANIWAMNADGTGMYQVTDNSATSISIGWASWSADATRIFYHSNETGNLEIYVVNIDGTGKRRLTNTPENEFDPDYYLPGS